MIEHNNLYIFLDCICCLSNVNIDRVLAVQKLF